MAEYIIQEESLKELADIVRERSAPTFFISDRSNFNPKALPDGITSIGDSAFWGCSSLALTSLPEGITSIGNSAFWGCSSLALTSLPEGITTIKPNAFYCCTNLALTSLPEGITSIGNSAFLGCDRLVHITLPASVTGWYGVFQSCNGLTSVTFRGTPTTIDRFTFANCTNLTTINVPWAEGAVEGAPWGATKATINYNYVG